MGQLEGQVAIVTGAGRGIGRAVARRLAAEGALVVVADIQETLARETAAHIATEGGRARAVQLDVASGDSVRSVFSELVTELGRIDILVNNAGITRPAMLEKMSEQQWDQVIAVHLKGTFLCTQAAVGPMRARRYGRIVNVTSAAGLVGTIGQANYAAAKGGIVAFTFAAARELARDGITVNAIAPAAATEMTQTIRTDPRFRDKYLERIPMGRWGEPEEIAPAVLFLASPESGYITGQVLAVDGGWVMR